MDDLRRHANDGIPVEPLDDDTDLHADPLDEASAMIMDWGHQTALAFARQRQKYWQRVADDIERQLNKERADVIEAAGGIQ